MEPERQDLLEELRKGALPRHVAIVMDGNGRWAKARGLPRTAGHKQGVETVREIVRMTRQLDIPVLTIFAFSTENWSRPQYEVDALMRLMVDAIIKEVPELHANGVRLRFIGDLSRLNRDLTQAVEKAHATTRDNRILTLNVAVNYGGRAEITRAARLLAQRAVEGKLEPASIREKDVADVLYTAGQPDVDLLIRTGGDKRISNFLLFQCAYAEFVVPSIYWPDFDRYQYYLALKEFQGRQRRFGGLGEEDARG